MQEDTAKFDVNLVFRNLNKRDNLISSGQQISVVDCSKGFCGSNIPDGIFNKKMEYVVFDASGH